MILIDCHQTQPAGARIRRRPLETTPVARIPRDKSFLSMGAVLPVLLREDGGENGE